MRFQLQGDLCQMASQKIALQHMGYTFNSTIPPDITGSNFGGTIKGALQLIWENSMDGWWNYKDELIKENICTEEEFKETLRIQVENKKKMI